MRASNLGETQSPLVVCMCEFLNEEMESADLGNKDEVLSYPIARFWYCQRTLK